eukprot:ctg_6108.g558
MQARSGQQAQQIRQRPAATTCGGAGRRFGGVMDGHHVLAERLIEHRTARQRLG